MEGKKMDFCTECRKETEYTFGKRNIQKMIKGKTYTFNITVAICNECGAEMSIPGLIDKNIQEIDEQYRAIENIVTIDDIENLMKVYNIGKAPLSLALGFGEITITRYLSGQIPSKEYSDIIRNALSSPEYMEKCLIRNKSKIRYTAYKKAMEEISKLEKLFCVSSKMLGTIAYIFKNLEEVTPLMLQKLLYFSQGLYMALYSRPIFDEDCEAWVHGPVYADVYNIFKDFKYNPIEDARFAMFTGFDMELSDDEKKVVDLVTKTFGLYGGKVLEDITHNETPWRKARRGYAYNIPSNEIIPKSDIEKYYKEMDVRFGIDSEEGLNKYISYMRQK